MVKLEHKKSGNWPCPICGKLQEGDKYHPYTVWYKFVNEKRGHNIPVCSVECGKAYIDKNF